MHKLQFFPQQQKPKNFSKQQQSILSLFGRITNSLHLRDLHTHNVKKQIPIVSHGISPIGLYGGNPFQFREKNPFLI